ncbi:MAG TPA: DUF1761 domain-containing protein [Saprospiraceae bacterium]|nr:DUF1761 domain-containing protein [Saprospiraceae bacterium]
MKNGKLAVAVLVAFVFFFLTDYLWYGMLMKPDTPMPGMRAEPNMVYMILGMLIYCYAFVTFYSRTAGPGTPVNEGARFGFWACLFVWIPMGLVWFGLLEYGTISDTIIEMVFRLVQAAVMGIIVGYLSGGGARGKGIGGGDG